MNKWEVGVIMTGFKVMAGGRNVKYVMCVLKKIPRGQCVWHELKRGKTGEKM